MGLRGPGDDSSAAKHIAALEAALRALVAKDEDFFSRDGEGDRFCPYCTAWEKGIYRNGHSVTEHPPYCPIARARGLLLAKGEYAMSSAHTAQQAAETREIASLLEGWTIRHLAIKFIKGDWYLGLSLQRGNETKDAVLGFNELGIWRDVVKDIAELWGS